MRRARHRADTTDMSRHDLSTPSGRFRARKAGFDVPIMKRGTPARTFDERIEKTDTCWLWRGATDGRGYGVYALDNHDWRACRFAWTRQNGPIPEGLVIRHKCDIPLCVNPDHLELGTHGDNTADRVSRGRSAKGSANGNVLLTEDAVRDIRATYRPPSGVGALDGTCRSLAEKYGVSLDAILTVVRRRRWRHVL